MKELTLFISLLLLAFSLSARAGYKGSFEPTDAEKAAHLKALPKLIATSTQCLERVYQENASFLHRYNVSKYYGTGSDFATADEAGKITWLQNFGFQGARAQEVLAQMLPTSCIGYAMKCLKEGFVASNQQDTWAKLEAYVRLNGVGGTALQQGLRALGWKVYYWNADPSQDAIWDKEEEGGDPGDQYHTWGNHAEFYAQVMKTNKYGFNDVDDKTTLVGFGKTTPAAMNGMPYSIGSVHDGYHIFSGMGGIAYEGHSFAEPSEELIQKTAFKPIVHGFAPHSGYKSGLIAVPPQE